LVTVKTARNQGFGFQCPPPNSPSSKTLPMAFSSNLKLTRPTLISMYGHQAFSITGRMTLNTLSEQLPLCDPSVNAAVLHESQRHTSSRIINMFSMYCTR